MGFLPRPLFASQGFGLSGKTCLRIGRLSISKCSKYNFSLVSAEFYGRILAVFVAILTCSYAHAWDEIWPQTWQSLITMLCPNGTKRIERMSVFLIMFFLKRTIPMFSPSGSLKKRKLINMDARRQIVPHVTLSTQIHGPADKQKGYPVISHHG